jgi:WD40 repeat protein
MLNSKRLIISALIFFISVTTHADPPTTDPILRIEIGSHSAAIKQIAVDAAERFLLTASKDKTLRLWNLQTGHLLKTYRVPIGKRNEGKLYSAAISPDAQWVATAGETGWEWDNKASIYVFKRSSGKLIKRLSGLDNIITHLCVSKDGHYLGATLGGGYGIRVWETENWQEIFSDTHYDKSSYSCDFDPKNRLVTTAFDGYLRLYSSTSHDFSFVAKTRFSASSQPYAAVFSPLGDKIAVSFEEISQINVLDGHDLKFLYAPDTSAIHNGSLLHLAWSHDGKSLYAGGRNGENSTPPILHWSKAGKGQYTTWQASLMTIMDIHPLKNGRLVYAAADPAFAVLDKTGNKIVEHKAKIADYRHNFTGFLISQHGHQIQFSFESAGKRPARFSLSDEELILNPPTDKHLLPPETTRLNITDWKNTLEPKLNGKSLSLYQYEKARSLAIAPDKSQFILGTEWYLRLFDHTGQLIWKITAPSIAWGVNISGDGKKIVAAFGDGTIRWYSLHNAEELLTFFPTKDAKRWIVWEPSGDYISSGDDTDNLIGWHINNGKENAALFYPINVFDSVLKKTDILKISLSH